MNIADRHEARAKSGKMAVTANALLMLGFENLIRNLFSRPKDPGHTALEFIG